MNIGTLGGDNYSTTSDYKRTKPKRKIRSFLVSERFLLTIIKILASDATIMRRKVMNIKSFLEIIDRDYYEKDKNLEAMLIVADSLVDSRIKNGKGPELETLLFKVDVLLSDDEFEDVKNNLIIPQIKVSKTDYVEDDIAYVSESLDQNLKFGFVLDTKEDLINLTSELTRCSYKDFPEIMMNYRNLLTSIMNFFRSTDDSTDINSVMHTSDPTFFDYLYDTYEAIRNPASALQTGWVALNSALGPRGGFLNKNLYVFHANTNSFKSALLLHIARMVKEYNAAKVIDEYKKSGKVPTVLFIEMENDFDEDNERLYKITAKKDIGKCTSREELHSSWLHSFDANKAENPIDISFLHVDARSVSVDDIDKIIELLEEEGFHVIMTIVDYIALIKPRAEDMNRENRLQLKNIADDLLSLAKSRNIPVVTAHQLNRSGGAVLTNLKMQGGANAVKQMTNEFVGESYGIEQAVSWSMFIDIEVHDGRKFLTMKRNKSRYQGKYGVEYFVYEIRDGIIIDDDIYLPKPLHLLEVPGSIPESETSYAVGDRGVVDIRDKPKTPPKDHVIKIKQEEETRETTPGFNMLNYINPCDWVDYTESAGFDNLVVCCDQELSDNSSSSEYIGETEFCFGDESSEICYVE